MKAIVTVAPYCPYIDEIVAHPAVSGIRLNTAMSVEKNTSLEDLLKSLQDPQEVEEEYDTRTRQIRNCSRTSRTGKLICALDCQLDRWVSKRNHFES